jgi:ribosome recycling factor
MAYRFDSFKAKCSDVEEWLKRELASIRTGRAAPVILDAVRVEAYGSSMEVREVANVVVEDPRTLRISPWDSSLTRAIEKGVIDSGLGLSVSVDDKGLRIIFPELTGERRAALGKLAKEKLEEARVSVRMERDRAKSEIEAEEKQGSMGEDEKFRLLEELQKHVTAANTMLEHLAEKKLEEISA